MTQQFPSIWSVSARFIQSFGRFFVHQMYYVYQSTAWHVLMEGCLGDKENIHHFFQIIYRVVHVCV